jgi:hypothetical protein
MNLTQDNRRRTDLATGVLFVIAAAVALVTHLADGALALAWLGLGALFLTLAAVATTRPQPPVTPAH